MLLIENGNRDLEQMLEGIFFDAKKITMVQKKKMRVWTKECEL